MGLRIFLPLLLQLPSLLRFRRRLPEDVKSVGSRGGKLGVPHREQRPARRFQPGLAGSTTPLRQRHAELARVWGHARPSAACFSNSTRSRWLCWTMELGKPLWRFFGSNRCCRFAHFQLDCAGARHSRHQSNSRIRQMTQRQRRIIRRLASPERTVLTWRLTPGCGSSLGQIDHRQPTWDVPADLKTRPVQFLGLF